MITESKVPCVVEGCEELSQIMSCRCKEHDKPAIDRMIEDLQVMSVDYDNHDDCNIYLIEMILRKAKQFKREGR